MKKHFSFLLALVIISTLVLSGCGSKSNPQNYKVSLEVWGLFDDPDVFAKAINEYRKANKHIGEIKYKKLSIDSFETDLRDALATGKGPDIFLIHNSWMIKHKGKLAPAPDQVLTAKQAQDVFVDVVTQDFTKDKKVYALPLSVDSLALYYNKNLFNLAGVPVPPRTWSEFDQAVARLTRVDQFGNIVLSGAAMGASSDAGAGEGKINRATDILTLLMMQAGAEMSDPKTGLPRFAEYTEATSGDSNRKPPGENALIYYTKFSNRDSQSQNLYCWNSKMHNSVDSFIEGQTAMMLNYSWMIPIIQSKAPKLNWGVTSVPQNIDSEGKGVNLDFANYWAFAVSQNKTIDTKDEMGKTIENIPTNDQRIFQAWEFVRYLTMPLAFSQDVLGSSYAKNSNNYDPSVEYALTQKKPVARRDLIGAQTSDALLAPFAQGNMIATSWPQPDDLAVERIFNDMIDNVALQNEDPREAIQQAQSAVSLLMQKK